MTIKQPKIFFGGVGAPLRRGALCHGTFGTMVNPALNIVIFVKVCCVLVYKMEEIDHNDNNVILSMVFR